MEKVKVQYPVTVDLSPGKESLASPQFIMRTIAASLCGASIPAVIFYFLM